MPAVGSNLIADTQRALSDGGRLTTSIPGFMAREPQIEMAVAIARAIDAKTTLVAEAGTGTGKTFSYLIPSLLSGKKVLVSTATKTLQDQLMQKDLPILIRALGLSLRTQNLKGRANYICRYRTELHSEQGQFAQQQCAHDIAFVREKLPQLTHGERGELPEIHEESPVWPYVTSTSDNCLGRECEHQQNCFLMKARKRAMEADIVVINHHLYFADSGLKTDGFGELLPNVDVVIFDEAHQLEDIATQFHGKRFSTRQLQDVMDDMLREWPVLDLANQPLKQYSIQLDRMLDGLLLALESKEDRCDWQDAMRCKAFATSWQELIRFIELWLTCLNEAEINAEDEPGLMRCKERLLEFKTLVECFTAKSTDNIRWLERFKRSLVFHITPFDIAQSFKALLNGNTAAYIFTSATLTMSSEFDCFTKPLGLEQPDTLLLPSPFDFKQQTLLYLPRGLPDPKSLDYYNALVERAVPVIKAFGGRCFFLFTSHRGLKLVADMLKHRLQYPLLVQGDEAKPILLSRFRTLDHAVLLGTATFWEGVDVKGEALSCVIIDKLPFASPNDPITRGKMAYLKSRGLSAFDELSLPNAVLTLKQGVGRLIRDVSDKGVLMLADPRLTGRDYAKKIFASLPSMPKTRDEQTVLSFIQELK